VSIAGEPRAVTGVADVNCCDIVVRGEPVVYPR